MIATMTPTQLAALQADPDAQVELAPELVRYNPHTIARLMRQRTDTLALAQHLEEIRDNIGVACIVVAPELARKTSARDELHEAYDRLSLLIRGLTAA